MRIVLCDQHEGLVAEWRARIWQAETLLGDIFAIGHADAVVSPANSFGFMDGGLDLAYLLRFGLGVQKRVQEAIRRDFGGELLVGQALSVPTNDADFPTLISAPTMRVPLVISDPNAVYLATRAAVREAQRIGAQSVVIPGMGTGCGRVKWKWAASMMEAAIRDALEPPAFPGSMREAGERHFAPFLTQETQDGT